MRTAKQAYEQVLKAVRRGTVNPDKMNGKTTSCSYRTTDIRGNMLQCGIGCLLSLDSWQKIAKAGLNSRSITTVADRLFSWEELLEMTGLSTCALIELQLTHDKNTADQFVAYLQEKIELEAARERVEASGKPLLTELVDKFGDVPC